MNVGLAGRPSPSSRRWSSRPARAAARRRAPPSAAPVAAAARRPPPARRVELTVFGAASLKGVLDKAKAAYETANPGTT